MTAFVNFFRDLFSSPADRMGPVIIESNHVVPAPAQTAPLPAGDGYFRVWVEHMYLQKDRDWFRTLYPVVQAATSFQYGVTPTQQELVHIAGPGNLRDVDEAHLNRLVGLHLTVTPLLPFNGGTVRIEAGLLAMVADDLALRFLSVLGNLASLLSLQPLTEALPIARGVAEGVQQLLGISQKTIMGGYYQEFVSGGSNALRPLYVAVLNAPNGQYQRDRFWVRDGSLVYGVDPTSAQELGGVDFMLMQVETRDERDDWKQLAAIRVPFDQAIDALEQVDDQGNSRVADADVFIRAAAAAARHSPELAEKDRFKVSRAIWDLYKAHKDEVIGVAGSKDAFGGPPAAPTIEDVGRAARRGPAEEMSLGDLFAS